MKVKEDGSIISYSEADRDKALQVSLTALAAELGYTVIRSGSHYSLKEMDSLIIYNDRSWNRWSGKGSITGGSQIDFLMAFGGIDSVPDAVAWLLRFNGGSAAPEESAPNVHEKECAAKDFALPPKNGNYKRLYAYLIQTRGLS